MIHPVRIAEINQAVGSVSQVLHGHTARELIRESERDLFI